VNIFRFKPILIPLIAARVQSGRKLALRYAEALRVLERRVAAARLVF